MGARRRPTATDSLPGRPLASAVGVYRLWRDAGYAFGALLAGIVADLLGIEWAIAVIAGLTLRPELSSRCA